MNNNLYRRAVQIAGSYSESANKQIVEFSHSLVKLICKSLFIKGATIICLVGKEDFNFDWDILESAYEHAKYMSFSDGTKNMVKVVNSDKNLKSHIPTNRKDLWENLIEKEIVYLKHIGNINSGEFKRGEQEKFSDALLILGGGEGVESSARLHVSHEKPVLALDIPLGSSCTDGSGGALSIYKESIANPMKYFYRYDVVAKLINLRYEKWKNDPESYANKILEFLEMIVGPSTNLTEIPIIGHIDENIIRREKREKNINIINPKIEQLSINNQGDNSPISQGDNSPISQGYSIWNKFPKKLKILFVIFILLISFFILFSVILKIGLTQNSYYAAALSMASMALITTALKNIK